MSAKGTAPRQRKLSSTGHRGAPPSARQGRTRPGPPAAMLSAAEILSNAGVPAARVAGTLRKLRKVLAAERSKGASAAMPGARAPTLSTRPFLINTRPTSAVAIARHVSSQQRLDEAEGHFERALDLEAVDLIAARQAYTSVLALRKDHLEARINLGRLMHLNGELEAAEKVYREAKQASATLAFNLGLLLEDLQRDEEAARSYREALALDPSLHEAHFNLGLLHERGQRPREALRHMLAFRRITQR
jgi:tetratricopeptide (TPR) repeat protein